MCKKLVGLLNIAHERASAQASGGLMPPARLHKVEDTQKFLTHPFHTVGKKLWIKFHAPITALAGKFFSKMRSLVNLGCFVGSCRFGTKCK